MNKNTSESKSPRHGVKALVRKAGQLTIGMDLGDKTSRDREGAGFKITETG